MPNRILKESITTSETLAYLSDAEERVWWRLVVVADDFGRFDGRPFVIRGKACASFLGRFTDAKIDAMVDRFAEVGLVRRYVAEGRPLLQIVTWDRHQQTRAKNSKYPAPSPRVEEPNGSLLACSSDGEGENAADSICKQTPADVPGSEKREAVARSETREANSSLRSLARGEARAQRASRWPDGFSLTPELARWAEQGGIDPAQEFAHFRDHHVAKGSRFVDWTAAWRTWCRRAYDIAQSRSQRAFGGR